MASSTVLPRSRPRTLYFAAIIAPLSFTVDLFGTVVGGDLGELCQGDTLSGGRQETRILNRVAGVIFKHRSPGQLMDAINKVAKDETWLDQGTIMRVNVRLAKLSCSTDLVSENHVIVLARLRQ